MPKVILPKVYEIKEDTPEKYHKFAGRPKISYSQYTSFKELMYRGSYIGGYFLGIKDDGNIFSTFGGKCGEYWEKEKCSDLGEGDILVLQTLPRPSTAKYETEIVVDRGTYVIQGFVDQEDEPEEGKLIITDLKTGNHTDKPKFYGGKDYQQTTLYSYCRDLEGYEILESKVLLLERKGNGAEKHPLRLSGKLLEIPTPYSRKRAETFLKELDKTVNIISNYFRVYNKIFKTA
jgi:hypothetical protein